MSEHVFYYNIIPYINDEDIIKTFSYISNDTLLSNRRKNIIKRKCHMSLNIKIQNFDFYDFDHKLLDGKLNSTFRWMKLLMKHLFCYTSYNDNIRSMNLNKIQIKKKHVNTPTIVNLTNFTDMKPSFVLDFSESVKIIRVEPFICEIYRMNSSHKSILIKSFRYAQALIY